MISSIFPISNTRPFVVVVVVVTPIISALTHCVGSKGHFLLVSGTLAIHPYIGTECSLQKLTDIKG